MAMSDRSWRAGDVDLRGSSLGDGPLALFLHAGRERRQVWDRVIDELVAEHQIRCVAVDQRGHGESTGTPTRLADFGADVATMLSVETRPVVIVGCSLGGMAAMAALANEAVRQAVVGLVLVDVVPDPDPDVARRFLGGRGLLEGGNMLVEDILAAGPSLRSTLAAAELPVLLVRGGRSQICDADAVDRLSRDAGSLVVAEIPEAGHLVARDAPLALARTVGPVIEGWLSPP